MYHKWGQESERKKNPSFGLNLLLSYRLKLKILHLLHHKSERKMKNDKLTEKVQLQVQDKIYIMDHK